MRGISVSNFRNLNLFKFGENSAFGSTMNQLSHNLQKYVIKFFWTCVLTRLCCLLQQMQVGVTMAACAVEGVYQRAHFDSRTSGDAALSTFDDVEKELTFLCSFPMTYSPRDFWDHVENLPMRIEPAMETRQWNVTSHASSINLQYVHRSSFILYNKIKNGYFEY